MIKCKYLGSHNSPCLVVPLKRLRKEDPKFKASLDNLAKPISKFRGKRLRIQFMLACVRV